MKNIELLFIPVLLFFSSCEKGDLTKTIICGFECNEPVVVSEGQFKNAPADHMIISKVDIQGDCLRIRFGAGGCDGKSWQIKLVASEMEYFSLPPQRDVRLSLKDNELCEAFIFRDVGFDISELRSSGNAVQLNILNADTSVLYYY